MRIGLLSGSLSTTSANQAALDVVHSAAVEAGVESATITGLAEIPMFDPAQVDAAPGPVAALRLQLDEVDGLVIAAPEYAAGLAGSTKNALDWLVGSATLYHKPVAVLSAGTTGGERAIDQLVHTLSWQGAWCVSTCGIASPRTKMTGATFTDTATIEALQQFTSRFVGALTGSPADRAAALGLVVSAYGIDIARFGEIT